MVAYSSHMYDIIIFVVICKAHGRTMLREHKIKGAYFLPFFPLKLRKFVLLLVITIHTSDA